MTTLEYFDQFGIGPEFWVIGGVITIIAIFILFYLAAKKEKI